MASIIIQKPQQMMFQLLADKKEFMVFKIAGPLIIFSKSFPPVIIVGNVLFSTLNLKKVKQVAPILPLDFQLISDLLVIK
jgi:hypothetical protein